jgi:hypothetical protein
MYGSHTSRKSMLAQGRTMSGTSPKRDEEKLVTPYVVPQIVLHASQRRHRRI